MRAQPHAEARQSPEGSSALMDAVDAVADMARRVKLNGPEGTYASEKLSYALYRSAEALALCGADVEADSPAAGHVQLKDSTRFAESSITGQTLLTANTVGGTSTPRAAGARDRDRR